MNFKKILLCGIFIMTVALNCFSQSTVLQWAKRIGSTQTDEGHSIAVDVSGNVYTTGRFQGVVDFDPGAATFTLSSSSANLFISKVDASGNFVWAKQLGGSGVNTGNSIVLDPLNNIYLTGVFSGTVDFNPGPVVFNLNSFGGSSDAFVAKFDASGNFLWAAQLGGTNGDIGNSIAIDALGNVCTVGDFDGTADFDPGAGITNLTSAGSSDIFISKLDGSGNFMWAKHFGSSSFDFGKAVALDGSGNVFAAGNFSSGADFDPGVGTSSMTPFGSSDVFISKFDASGNFLWAKQIGGTNNDFGNALETDASGNVYTVGNFYSTSDFDPSPATFTMNASLGGGAFVSKLDGVGNFIWAKQMGAFGAVGNSIDLDASNNIYLTGHFAGFADFDPSAAAFNITSFGSDDIFVSKLDASGNFVWAKQIGGTGGDYGKSVAVDIFGNVHSTGYFDGTADFDPDAAILNMTSLGWTDIYIHKMSQTVVGIQENTQKNKVLIYPNPSSGKFFIHSETLLKTEVYNALGERLFNESATTQIDLSTFPKGMYFAICSDENGIKSVLKLITE